MAIFLIDSLQRIKDNSIIDNNVDDRTLKVSLKQAQDLDLEPILGTRLYRELLDGVENDNLTNDEKTLIVDYIWDFLIAATVVKIAANLTFRFANIGLSKGAAIKQNSEANNTPGILTYRELNAIRKENESIANYYREKITRFLKHNTETYPSYLEQTEDEIESTQTNQPIDFHVDDDILDNYEKDY